jgi:hypothetical protein
MEEQLDSATLHPVSGDLTRLQARLTDFVNWLAPAWAAWCGALASGGFEQRGASWLKLSLLILLVDVGWGVLWAALGSTDWATPLHRWRAWRSDDLITAPPYTLPGSPGDRVSRWLGQLRGWRRAVLWPTRGFALTVAGVALLATAVLGAVLGRDLLLLSVAALAVMQLGVAGEGGRGAIAPKWDAVISIALPWLAGHIVFSAGATAGWAQYVSAVGLALVFALAWGAARRADSGWERLLGAGTQLLAVALFVALRIPLAAAGLLALLVPQLMLYPWMRRGLPASWYVRLVRPWLMAAMLLAAWALRA